MKLREYEGKELFRKYGIEVPKSEIVERNNLRINLPAPVVLKAQVFSGDRKKAGGIAFVKDSDKIKDELKNLFAKKINDEEVGKILVEELVDIKAEYYVSISYETMTRGPVLALNKTGGSGISQAKTFPLDILSENIPVDYLKEILTETGFEEGELGALADIMQNLWKLFIAEYALLAEINPIFKTKSDRFIAGDAKVIIDDEKVNPDRKPFVYMGGDIAVLAAGGGASMLNMDALLEYGGRPANYVEYSGNPKADVVRDLTRRVLEQPGLNGLWLVGVKANFTDMHETMKGFIDGLESLAESIGKPEYPILIRRDGPRGEEAREMLRNFAKEKGYNMHVYGSELPMEQSAKMIVELAKEFASKSEARNPKS